MRVELLAALLLAACSLRPPPDASRYYTLAPGGGSDRTPEPADDAAVPGTHDLVVGLGPVDIPGYLDRTHMVRRVGPNEIRVAESARWAEPLRDGIARVLQQDLRAAAGVGRVVLFPWSPATPLDVTVRVDVLGFEAVPGDHAEVAARWTIRESKTGRVLAVHESRLSEDVDGRAEAAEVAALSRGLGALAREIAAALPRSR